MHIVVYTSYRENRAGAPVQRRRWVEDRARNAILLPGLGLPHDGKHARSGQGLEMRVGRNVDDRRAPIHGLSQDARHDLSVNRSGLGYGHLEQVNQDVPHGGPVLGQSPICGSLR